MNLKMLLEKSTERANDVFLCFIDYSKAFDAVIHNILCNDMHKMGFLTHIILLIKALYHKHKAAVKMSYVLTELDRG